MPSSAPVPRITQLSTLEAAVGDEIVFQGEGFVDAQDGWVDVHFHGEFVPLDGSVSNEVDLVVPLRKGMDGALTWGRFGGYRVPFTPTGAKLGRFEGEIFAENHLYPASSFFPDQNEGSVMQKADPLVVTFYVLPSLVVLDNRAFGDNFVADCKDPSVVLLEGMRYALRVKALGFEPARFEFSLSEGLLQADMQKRQWRIQQEPTQYTFPAQNGDEHALVHRWSPAPGSTTGYRAGIGVTAYGVGMQRSVYFPFTVRRWSYPDFLWDAELAELLPPQPVSGCIPGGPASLQVSYKESTAETRTRALGTSLARNVEQVIGEQNRQTYTFSQTDTFAQTQSSSVSVGDTTTSETSQSTTDLFSATGTRARADSLGWSASNSGTGITTITDTSIDLPGGSELTETSVESTVGVSAGIASYNEKVKSEANYGTERVVGANRSYSTQSRDRFENQDTGQTNWEATNAATRGFNYQVGTTFGRSLSYEEQLGISETRRLDQQQTFGQALVTSQSVAASLGTTEEEVITQSSTREVSIASQAFVWAGKQGMWYRQTARHVTRGVMVALDYCGNSTVIGGVSVSEWAWAADLGIGDACPPPSNLPPAECRIPPCN